MMRALVVGASGFVGWYLRLVLAGRGHEVWGTFHSDPLPGLLPLDILDAEASAALVTGLRPDAIFVPAAIPNVDWCEAHPAESFQVNVLGLCHLLEAGKGHRSRLVFFSTEYVFDGTRGPYSEGDRPNPISVYGRQKLAGEEMVLGQAPENLVVRTTVVYGWERRARNFSQRLLAELQAGRRVKVPSDQVSSPTYVPDLAEAACELAEKGCTGLYHVAGSQRVSRCVLARAVADVFGLDGDLLVPTPSALLGQTAPRPLSAGLEVEKLRRELGWAPDGFGEGLARMKRERATWPTK